MKNIKFKVNNYILECLVAETDQQLSQGLMYRVYPFPNMLFKFSEPGIRKFWMKNVYYPLDIIFISDNTIVDIFQASPNDSTLIGPDYLVDVVLEMPVGSCEQFNIKVGTKIFFDY